MGSHLRSEQVLQRLELDTGELPDMRTASRPSTLSVFC